jgi:hypothetical protein
MHVIGEEFQSHSAIKAGVQALVDDTHSTGTKFFQDAIVRNGPVNHGEPTFNFEDSNYRV